MHRRRRNQNVQPHASQPQASHDEAQTSAHDDASLVRLQKVLALAGFGSRRKCEELILAGRVEIDRQPASELGTKVDPDRSEVRVDGQPIHMPRLVYYAVNKPTNVVSTNFDPSGRTRVVDLLPPTSERLFTVGRLDKSSEGLILVTNDGALANQLAHPRYGVEKTYHVLVAGVPQPELYAQLRQGVHLAEGLARVASVRVKTQLKHSTMLEIVLREGKNREIRRILAKLGHKVMRLKRVAVGDIRLGDLPSGEHRRLRSDEVAKLRRAAGARRKPARSGKARSRGRGRATPSAASRETRAPRQGAHGKPSRAKPTNGKATAGKPASGKPAAGKPASGKFAGGRPVGRKHAGRKSSKRPARSEHRSS